MKKRVYVFLNYWLYLLFCFCSPLYADGKFFYNDHGPRDLPYQRAILTFDGESETLLIQSSYHGVPSDVAWVVPVPSLPEVATLPEGLAWVTFNNLAKRTRTEYIYLDLYALGILVSLVLLILLFRLIIRGFIKYSKIKDPHLDKKILKILVRAFLVSLIIPFVLVAFYPEQWEFMVKLFIFTGIAGILSLCSPVPTFATLFILFLLSIIAVPNFSNSSSGVNVYSKFESGPYEVQIIDAENGLEIINWLKQEGFHYTKEDESVFNNYIKQKWYFVTAKVLPHKDKEVMDEEILVRPLTLRFKTPQAIYPLALTGNSGAKTDVYLYVYAPYRMKSDGRLPTRYAAQKKRSKYWFNSEQFKLFPKDESKYLYLTRMSGTLTADQMKADLYLEKARDNSYFREVIYK